MLRVGEYALRLVSDLSSALQISLAKLGRNRLLSLTFLACLPLAYQAWLTLHTPLPYPAIHDEYSMLLGADTLARGRLSNPPHPLHAHFESPQILVQPAYATKYPLAQPAFLAAGQLLVGHPFWGVVFSVCVAVAATAWASRAITGPGWAFVSGAAAAVVFGTLHYWVRSYWGGAVIFAGSMFSLGGTLRLVRHQDRRGAWALALGLALMFFSRPLEGGMLAAGLFVGLLWRFHTRADVSRFWRPICLPLALTAAAVALIQIPLNLAVTGNPWRMPYTEYVRQYQRISPVWILPPDPRPPVPIGGSLALHHHEWKGYAELRQAPLNAAFEKLVASFLVLEKNAVNPALLAVFLLVRGDPVALHLLVLSLFPLFGFALSVLPLDHYAAPLLAVLWLCQFRVMECMQKLRSKGFRIGSFASLVWLALLIAPHASKASLALLNGWTDANVFVRREVAHHFERLPGNHVVFVRRGAEFNLHREWVYNGAEPDSQKVVWLRDLGPLDNQKAFAYYQRQGRRFWRVEPEQNVGGGFPRIQPLNPADAASYSGGGTLSTPVPPIARAR
ncbi:MAG: hypothetical protein NZV14_09420 [Bryobacteraceae bacterium]|nr:hypothetical protein [Bryobacteraceae bacterium]MDW8378371.1 hypothetical protein [Bryobacterales bacterium]